MGEQFKSARHSPSFVRKWSKLWEERWVSFSCTNCETSGDIEEYWVWKDGEEFWNDCDECGEKMIRKSPMVCLGEFPSLEVVEQWEEENQKTFDLDWWMENVSTWKRSG